MGSHIHSSSKFLFSANFIFQIKVGGKPHRLIVITSHNGYDEILLFESIISSNACYATSRLPLWHSGRHNHGRCGESKHRKTTDMRFRSPAALFTQIEMSLRSISTSHILSLDEIALLFIKPR